MFREALTTGEFAFTDAQLEQFQQYFDVVTAWNAKMNLTAITDAREFAVKHVIDSLALWDDDKFVAVKSCIDVGTGAGFPGIPLKIFKPHLEIVLLDSLAKRVEFLKRVVAALGLNNVTCIHGRAEELARQEQFREHFDLVTARAVARLNVIAEYCLPLTRIGGTFVALKGKQFREEVSEASTAIKTLGGDNVICIEKSLPNLPDVRAVIYVDKVKPTPKKFPRRAGIPAKNPIT